MKFDGISVSLSPSIGNWNSACRSHYIIDDGRVVEASSWSDAEIEEERRRDKAAKAEYYESLQPIAEAEPVLDSKPNPRPFVASSADDGPMLECDTYQRCSPVGWFNIGRWIAKYDWTAIQSWLRDPTKSTTDSDGRRESK